MNGNDHEELGQVALVGTIAIISYALLVYILTGGLQ